MIIGVNSVINIYEYFYQKKYNSSKYRFKPSSAAVIKIHKFLSLIDKEYNINTLGKVFLTNYFIFQFNRTHKQVFKRFASRDILGSIKVGGRVQIQDIVGKKAFEYWVNRDQSFDWTLQGRRCDFVEECNISFYDAQMTLKENEAIVADNVIQSEEIEKRRFFNETRGFINCLEKTSLFNPESPNCTVCKFRSDCKKVLKENYPQIYKQRNYEVRSV